MRALRVDRGDLAYFRDTNDFRSCRLVEQENGDFGQTIARQLIFATYQYELFSRLVDSKDETIAAVAAKALKEVMYHLDHAAQWTLRLGDGTQESHRRIQEGLYYMWPYVDELFADDDLLRDLAERGIAVLPSTLRESFDQRIQPIIEQATLEPCVPGAYGGDRTGRFSEHRSHILGEQVVARHPRSNVVMTAHLQHYDQPIQWVRNSGTPSAMFLIKSRF